MTDIKRVRANVATMIDQGAPAEDINRYLASEGLSEQDLRGRMSPQDEQAFASLAADPKSTAADLQSFARQRGFDVTDEDAAGFIASRSQPGARVTDDVTYRAPDRLTGSNTTGQNARAVAGDLVDGILPGSAKFARGVRSVAGNAFGALSGVDDFDPSAAFQEGEREQQLAQARFNADHPVLASAAGWTGTAAGLLAIPEAKLVKGASKARGVLNGAANGLGWGALGGLLNDTGGGRLENAGWGALAGTGLGALAPAAIGVLSSTGAAVRRNVPGMDRALSEAGNLVRQVTGQAPLPAHAAAHAQAERVLHHQLDGAKIATGTGTGSAPATPANIAAEVSRRQSLGIPAIPADVTEPARRATSRALRGEGQMATRARGMIVARQAQQGARIRQHITDELGPAVDPIQAVEEINRRASAAAGPGYRAAYARPMVLTPEIESIMRTPAFQDALPQALRNIRNAQRNPTELGFRLDSAGNISGAQTLTVEGFDQVIRAMREAGQAAMDTSGFKPRNTTNSVHINARANDLRGHIANQNEAYRDVTASYADEMAVRDALGAGQDVSKLTGPEINGQMRDMPEHAQEAWMTGARTALADEAMQAGLKPTANVAQRTRQSLGLSGAGLAAAGGDSAKLQAIEAATGQPGVLSLLDDRLEAEDQAFQTFANVAKAAPQIPQDEQALQAAAMALGTAGKAATGNWKGAAADILLRGQPQGTRGFRKAFDDRTAALLTAEDPADVALAMTALDRRAATDSSKRVARNKAAGKAARVGVLSATAQPTALMNDAVDPWAVNPAGALYPAYRRGILSDLSGD